MIQKGLLLLLVVPLLAVCATRRAVSLPPAGEAAPPEPGPPFDLDEKAREAEALVARGGYVHLRRAFSLYQDIEKYVPGKSRFATGYAETALLLAARAKEAGIRNGAYLAKARELVRSDESLAALAPAVGIVDLAPVRTLGVWDDSPGREAGPARRDFTATPAAGPFFAYVHALLLEQSGRNDAVKPGLDEALKMFPDSLLLKYKRAVFPPADLRLLKEIAGQEPEFFESFLEQGQLALAGGALITAEKHLLRAQQGISESPLLTILLASVSFGIEEYDRSLAFYDETLDSAPAYKEALLGKAICLSCLGRSAEAIPILENLLARGPALNGECFYWLAANFHETGDDERAAVEIEKAKAALPVARVYTLAGTIAFERGFSEAAERDLKTAVGLDSGESDALFLLGKIYARRSIWLDSALNFMLSGYGYESEEKGILVKIGQIEESQMPEERKARLLARKRFLLEKTRLTKATAHFNAAAGYYNAGDLDKALTWVRNASAHAYFAGKAKQLIALISSGKE